MAVAGKLEIAPGVELARTFWTHPAPLQSRVAFAQLCDMAPRWPKGHAPQGFMLIYAPAIKGSDVILPDGETITIANRIQSPSVRGNHIKGPHRVLIVVGQYPEARDYAPLRAYAQPIFNGRLFVPVESDFERRTLRCLLDCQRDVHRNGVDVAIAKPLSDTLTPLGTCRPNFLIEARSRVTGEVRTLVIEALGFDTLDYEASKAVTHPRMATIAELLSVTPAEIDTNEVRTRILAALDF